MVDPLRIRPAVESDVATLADFNARLAWETERLVLDRDVVSAGVARLLAEPARGRYFLAEANGAPVGQTLVTYEWSDWRNGCLWWIQSVYVDPAARGAGVFRSLYQHIQALAKADADTVGLRLYVEHQNRQAQEAYAKLGMIDAGYVVYESVFRNAPQRVDADQGEPA